MSRALGRYELLRPLARGGMAEVFLARRRAAGVEKLLVVKRMRPERVGDPRFLDLFVREARLSMSLTHQNIVPVFDFGRIDDQVFIAMERIEGRDFGSSLKAATDHPIPPLLAAFVAAECCQALDYAHLRKGPDGAALGIVHRDVTPRNVLLSWSGEVKLTDFGIAALAGDDPTKVIGTAAYMAPEQARGESVDRRADVYAVGLVLRVALTGVRARAGDEREAILAAARRGELLPWPAGFESPLVAIVDRATALDRDARYPDARSMLEALDGFIVGERAAKKTDAPARALAAWLGEVWREQRDEPPIDESGEGSPPHLVSFLDDGALDVIGTGTERSMAATAADAGEPPAVSEKIVTAPAPAAKPASRRWMVPAIAIAVVVAGAGGMIARSGSSPDPTPNPSLGPTPSPGPDPTPSSDPIVHAKPDPTTKADPAAKSDPKVGSSSDLTLAPSRLAGDPIRKSGDAHHGAIDDSHSRHGSAAHDPIATPVVHKVQIGATPWAYFTIDDVAASHQTPETITLALGAHVIHFSHPQLGTREVSITVPDADTLTVVQDLRK